MKTFVFLLFAIALLSTNCCGKLEDAKVKRNSHFKRQVSQNMNKLASHNAKPDQKTSKNNRSFGQKYSNTNQPRDIVITENREPARKLDVQNGNNYAEGRRVSDPEYENKFSSDLARLKAEITRLLLRSGDGAAVSTRFTAQGFTRYTYVKMQMIADIPDSDRYAGIPYFFMSRNDTSVRDLIVDNKASFLLAQAMNDENHHECEAWPLKSQDFKCHKAVFVGDFVDLQSNDEPALALAEFERRYYLKIADLDDYFVSKMNIRAIYIGEGEPLPLRDYYNARPYGWNILTDQGDGPAEFPDFEVFTQPSASKNQTRK